MIRRCIALAFASSCGLACTIDAGPGRLSASAPERADFVMPGKILVARCGSLDCHGGAYRNYRLVGYGGSRLDPSHRPDAPSTTDAELTWNYDATVAVEPERTRAIAGGRERVDGSTLIRKARGSERHEGGARIAAGSAADTCIIGWLSRSPNAEACASAAKEIGAR